MREQVAAKQMDNTTAPKGGIDDYRSMDAVNSTIEYPTGERACSPYSSFPPSTTYPPSPNLYQSQSRMPFQLVQANGFDDNRDRPLMLPMEGSYLKSSRVGLKLYRGDDDNYTGMERAGEGIEGISFDNSDRWDAPYIPGPEADNRQHCLTWLRNVPKPGSFQVQDAPSKRE